MHWPKSPSWNGTQIVQKKETFLHRTFTKASWSWGTSNVPIIYLEMGQSKWLLPKRKKTKFCDHYCTLFHVASFQKQICTASFCSFVHIPLLFGQQHLLSRTTLTFTYWVQSEPNCYGTIWGVDGWMVEVWINPIINSAEIHPQFSQERVPIHWWLIWVLFIVIDSY